MNHEIDDTPTLVVPEFKSNIPAHLADSLPESERWLYAQVSIALQQNEWLIQRAVKVDRRQVSTDRRLDEISEKVRNFEELKATLTGRWSVVAMLFGGLLLPVLLLAIGAWLNSRFTPH